MRYVGRLQKCIRYFFTKGGRYLFTAFFLNNKMKKIFISVLLFLFTSVVIGQTFYCTKNILFDNCKVNFINNVPTIWAQLDAKTLTWAKDQVGSYIIKDGNTQVTIKNDGCLVLPTFANLDDSLIAWQNRCLSTIPTPLDVNIVSPLPLPVDVIGIDTVRVIDSVRVWFENPVKTTDTTHTGVLSDIYSLLLDSLDKNIYINNDSIRVHFNHVSDTANTGILNAIHNLLVDSLDKNVFINNDSIRVWFEQKNDTIDYEYKSYCYRGKLDSGVYSFNVVFSALTPNTPTFINFTDVDSLYTLFEVDYRTGATIGVFPNIAQDYVPCEKWFEYLSANAVKDTIKSLVYTTTAKVRTDRDTLFNCKSLSFGRKSNASGTLILTYENGESESFDVANDDLPTWVNGEFISYIDYNATGAIGLIVNATGCSQTSDNICAKAKPIFDCELNIPIQCLGWQSVSGVWQSASGCWNTGQ